MLARQLSFIKCIVKNWFVNACYYELITENKLKVGPTKAEKNSNSVPEQLSKLKTTFPPISVRRKKWKIRNE